MEMKVLANLNWHHGIPDGEEEVSILLDDCDIENKDATSSMLQKSLVNFGVEENTLTYLKEDSLNQSPHVYLFEGEIGRFDSFKKSGVKPFTSFCTIEVSLSYVMVHRGKVFSLNELISENIINL